MGKKNKIRPLPLPSVPLYSKAVPIAEEKKQALGTFLKKNEPLNVHRKYDLALAPRWPGWHCTAVWEIIPDTEHLKTFNAVAEQLGNVQVLYHGTRTNNIRDIAKEGLRPGSRSCMFGSGIYLGGIQKAVGYTEQYAAASYILQVKVALGKVKKCAAATELTLRALRKENFDSAMGVAGVTKGWNGHLQYSEHVVYSPDQALVMYIFEYRNVNPALHNNDLFTGNCEVVRKKDVPLSPGTKAFADILQETECRNKTKVHVKGDDGYYHWICNTCIKELSLRGGSSIQVKQSSTSCKTKHLKTVRLIYL
jgi:hypothetical protein